MGSARLLYKEKFPVGTQVQILDADELNAFAKSGRYHHPLAAEQLEFSGRSASVKKVGFYHGGDVLYELQGAPGYWHEQCLQPAKSR